MRYQVMIFVVTTTKALLLQHDANICNNICDMRHAAWGNSC